MVETASRRVSGRTYAGEAVRAVAMPLGGIGTGQIALGGDGGLRQWQIINQSNHLAFVPDSFFAIRASHTPDPGSGMARILQSEAALALPKRDTPLINDDVVPDQQRALVKRFGGVTSTTFTGAYPFARIAYDDDALPVEVGLEAFSPYIPLSGDDSELPAIIFRFTVRNPGPAPVWGALGATMKNIVGWDTVTPIVGNRCPRFGGNVNTVQTTDGVTSIVMEHPSLPWDDPGRGQIALSTLAAAPFVLPAFADPAEFMATFQALALETRPPAVGPVAPTGRRHPDAAFRNESLARSAQPAPSAPGETVNGGLAIPFHLEAGEETTIPVVLTWSFPNFYVNFQQFGHLPEAFNRSRLWLGNAYTTRFRNALDALASVVEHWDAHYRTAQAWSEATLGGSLPVWLQEFLAAQGALIRSPTIFRTEDGKLYGFEGTQGASTSVVSGWPGYSGSCPLNCTHVWTYEQALSRHFPALERTMRETDYDVAQAPEGYIPHRTVVPTFAKQFWNQPIGGPENPALDGMLSTLLKTWREIQQGAGEAWAAQYWPKFRKLVDYIRATWDPDGDGVLDGEQPNTYDIAFYGTNMFIGALWLAALRAAEEYARLQGEDAYADDLHALFRRGQATYDRLLWNGEYYIQILGPDDPVEQQYLTGCLADQLLGQWWAHQLGLGYVLPRERVRTTLQSILNYNMREGFAGYDPEERAFADGDDAGLLIIAWPEGGRPDRPTRYHDEVWTGIEYQVAAHCIYEGLVDEGLHLVEVVRARYDGTKRNPYNDIECGDHYARAMAGWTVLEALAGYRYDAIHGRIVIRPAVPDQPFSGPFLAGTGWGTFSITPDGAASLTLAYGTVTVQELDLPPAFARAGVRHGATTITATNADGSFVFARPVTLSAGETLTIA